MAETFEEMLRIAEAEGDYALDIVRRQQDEAARKRGERAVLDMAKRAKVLALKPLSFMPNEELIKRGRRSSTIA